jgi:hypothetical protein
MDDKPKKHSRLEGEGSYSGTRAYNEATARFLKKAAEAKGRSGDPKMGEKSPHRPK